MPRDPKVSGTSCKIERTRFVALVLLPVGAFALSRLSEQNLEHTVMGIFRQVIRPTYDEMARDQVSSARDSKPHDTAALQSLLRGKDTWTVN